MGFGEEIHANIGMIEKKSSFFRLIAKVIQLKKDGFLKENSYAQQNFIYHDIMCILIMSTTTCKKVT